MSEWIPDDKWETIVRNVPIISVDLVVECPAGLVLGKRTNEPAKGEWFVPGGRVHKEERLRDAVDRIAREELDTSVTVKQRLGTFEHFYEKSEVADSKHYVGHGFHVWTDDTKFDHDDQHATLSTFETVPEDLHEYVAAYLDAIES